MSAPGAHAYRVVDREEPFVGAIFTVVTEEVTMPGGGTARRDYTHHHGAVAVVALDEQGRAVLVRQYRHPVGEVLWELPAGLLDLADEPAISAAQRELAEEVDLTARRWDKLIDVFPSPGTSDERIQVFLARDLAEVPDGERHQREHEEADLVVARIDLDQAVTMALRGEIINGAAVAGLLAAARVRDLGG
ncbi:MAG TPA: NUDIX hydrolase [Micromonosporaceae bacterium]